MPMENKDKTTPEDIGHPPTSTPPLRDSNWVMNGINRLDQRLEGMDERLRKVENQISKILGWGSAMFFFMVILQIVLKFTGSVEISFK